MSSPKETKIGRFVVRARVGAGAFGTVYRAFDPQLEREVALKVPQKGTLDSPKAAERFLREAKAAARLRHPHIVPVYEAAQDAACPYIATAFIEGRTLAQVLDAQPPDLRHAVQVVHDLADALAYAHGQGVVHRDVKPANVMLDTQGRALLMDFGLAQQHDEVSKLTGAGAVIGTPSYMSPEQARGSHGPTQPASDQYSLGVVLYELLCGQTPFAGSPGVVLYNVVHTDPPPPRAVNAAVPPELEAICLRAMAKRPEHRFASMSDFAAALAGYLWAGTGSATATTTVAPVAADSAERVFSELTIAVEAVPKPRARGGSAYYAAAAVTMLAVAAVAYFVLRPQYGSVQLELSDPRAEVAMRLDGRELPAAEWARPMRLPVGKHELEATGKAVEPVKQTFEVSRGENKPVRVELKAKTAPPPPKEPGKVALPPPNAVTRDQDYSKKSAPGLPKDPGKLPPVTPKVVPKAPQYNWSAAAVRDGRVPAPNVSKAKVLYTRGTDDGKAIYSFEGGLGGALGSGAGHFTDFAVELVFRNMGVADEGGLSVFHQSEPDHRLHAVIHSNGNVKLRQGYEGSPSCVPFKHPAVKAGKGETNTLLVVIRGRIAEVYVNSTAVCEPLTLDREIGAATTGFVGWLGARGRIEFLRVTVYSTEGIEIPVERPVAPAPKPAVVSWAVADILEGRVAAPDTSKAKKLFDDAFADPKSGFEHHTEPDGSREAYVGGKYVITNPARSSRRSHFIQNFPTGEGAYELRGRLRAGPTDAWDLQLNNYQQKIGLAVRIRNNGTVSVSPGGVDAVPEGLSGPSLAAVAHPAVKKNGELNTLLVVMRKGSAEVYVNGAAVFAPIALDPSFDPKRLQFVLSTLDAGEVEFERLTVYAADGLPALAPTPRP